MKICVCVKQVPDSWAEKKLTANDSTLDRAAADRVVNELDEYAVEEALRIVEASEGEVTILSMGPDEAADSVRKAISMGAHAGIHISDPALHGSDALATSLVLAKALEGRGFDLIMFGSESTDARMSVVPAMVSARLGLPQMTFANKVEVNGSNLTIHRVTDYGYDEVQSSLPAVVSVVEKTNEPRYPSFKNIMAAKKAPMETLSLADIGLDAASVGLANAWSEVKDFAERPAKAKGTVITDEGNGAEKIEEFLVTQKFIGVTVSEVLVLIEHSEGNIKKVSLELLAMAAGIGEPSAVFVGPGADAALATLGDHGAKTVYVADGQAFLDHVVVPSVDVLAKLVSEKSPAAVLIPSSADGKEIAGRLAVAIDSGVITDAVAVSSDVIATQNVFGGATIVHSKVSKGTPVITVRTNSIAPVQSGGTATRVDVSVEVSAAASATKVVNRVSVQKSGRPDLSEAAIVVSGGRGVGSDEGFASVIEPLADSLGAAVGASRAATDAGWYPHQFQVGQTGKTVSPQLYIANGISGAIQHRAGMQTSKTVVVVNKDVDAPIFDLADFGVVGDLHSVVPDLTARVKARK